VRCALADNDMEAAESLSQLLQTHHKADLEHPAVKQAFAALEIARKGRTGTTEQEELKNRIETSGGTDLQARYDLALSYFQSGRHTESLEQCFEIIKKDKEWQQQAAKKLCLQIFEALGSADPVVKQGRKKLANLLFC
jgi:putative thioredoxin